MYVPRSTLKLREACELDSAKAGELKPSSIICVLERLTLPDGTSTVDREQWQQALFEHSVQNNPNETLAAQQERVQR